VAKPELGIKRTCPVTGRKFYDLNRDPIVSPYTGQAYSRSIFEPQAKPLPPEVDDTEEAEPEAVELVALEEADEPEAKAADPVVSDDLEIEDDIADAADDTFLEDDEEGDDDVSDLIDGDIADEEEP
jgi:uncharacterized protein (TIGR02300 family)